MEEPRKHTKLSLANRITILRILSVPLFILTLVYYTQGLASGKAQEIYRAAALIIFAILAVTDALDGYLARSRSEITPLGKLLDPLADKALLLSGLVLLTKPALPALEPQIPVWFTVLVISRDVVLILGAAIIHAVAGSVEVKPRIVGKIATFFQMVTVTWVLVDGPSGSFMYCVAVAGLFTFGSGAVYLLDGIRQLERTAGAHRHNHHAASPTG
jgi:cardiolipin synthase (CMP-forming)